LKLKGRETTQNKKEIVVSFSLLIIFRIFMKIFYNKNVKIKESHCGYLFRILLKKYNQPIRKNF
jgi:hypothetical protein